MLVIIVQ